MVCIRSPCFQRNLKQSNEKIYSQFAFFSLTIAVKSDHCSSRDQMNSGRPICGMVTGLNLDVTILASVLKRFTLFVNILTGRNISLELQNVSEVLLMVNVYIY